MSGQYYGNGRRFDSAEQAAMAYDQAAFAVRGPMAVLNFLVDRVRESLEGKKNCGCGGMFDDQKGDAAGCSPVLALKGRHSVRRKSTCKKSKDRQLSPGKQLLEGAAHHYKNNDHHKIITKSAAGQSNVVVLEDLGADCFEKLLRTCTDNHH
ncbi:unnamed protein product [Linum trigynum]|uniref:AP2/ERF domain-containing protein n=1 Tax=Linum trigynum TaxID=586398 RepID=A0AAV2D7S8_9ROSI